MADRGDGTYKNPILHADYSDPDVIRGRVTVSQVVCKDAEHGAAERQAASAELHAGTVYLPVSISANAMSRFGYSTDGAKFIPKGEKVGLFALGTVPAPEYGYADYDWFRVQ